MNNNPPPVGGREDSHIRTFDLHYSDLPGSLPTDVNYLRIQVDETIPNMLGASRDHIEVRISPHELEAYWEDSENPALILRIPKYTLVVNGEIYA